jgi:acyl carrier protein
MTELPMAISRPRQIVFEALRIAAPSGFNDELRHAFLAEGSNFELAELDMDSLANMEFCIAIELSTGITLLPPQLAEFATTDAIERCIRAKLGRERGCVE